MTTTSPRADADAAVPYVMPTGRRLYVILAALMSGMFLSALDQTIVSTALPTIAGDLHRADLLSWVVTAYLLTSTATAPLYGKIGDLYGRKKVFQIAIIIFLASSVLCALASSMFELIVFRGLQGAGAGGILTLTFAIIGDLVPLRERGKYQGYFSATFLAASVLGPLLGGFAVDQLSWHAIFWINLPLGAVTLLVVQRSVDLPKVRTEHKVDLLGAALVMSGISALLIAVHSGGNELSWTSPELLGIIALGLALLLGFVLWERVQSEPLLPLDLFKLPAFVAPNAMMFSVCIAMFGTIVFIPQYLQIVHGVSATESGLRTLPTLLGMSMSSTIVGRRTSRSGRYRHYPIIGTVIGFGGVFLLADAATSGSLTYFAIAMFVLGAGLGMVMQTLVLTAQNAVPPGQIGVATSTVTFFRSMGGSIGASLIGAILTAQFAGDVRHAVGGSSLSTSGRGSVLSSPEQVAHLPGAVRDIVRSSYEAAMHTTLLWVLPVMAVAFALSWRLKDNDLRERSGAVGAEVPEALEATELI